MSACDQERLPGGAPPSDLAMLAASPDFASPDLVAPCSEGTNCAGQCVDLTSDVSNCGVCRNMCPVGVGCAGGRCFGCLPGFTSCSGNCVDLKYDRNNCGACGQLCPAAAHGDCVRGECVCGNDIGRVCNGVCVLLYTDPNNCGACGNVCIPPRVCADRQCR